jgi:hypothetical protein
MLLLRSTKYEYVSKLLTTATYCIVYGIVWDSAWDELTVLCDDCGILLGMN